MNANMIGDPALGNRDDCATDDRHDQDAGTVPSKGTEFGHPQREDAWEHDRVEEAHQQNAPHGRMPVAEH